MGNVFATVKTDEDWKEETGLNWPDERPLDEVLLTKGAGIGKQFVHDELKKLESVRVVNICALLGTYDKQNGKSKMETHGLGDGSAGALWNFIKKVKEERANCMLHLYLKNIK